MIHVPSKQVISTACDNKGLQSDTLDKYNTLLDGGHVLWNKCTILLSFSSLFLFVFSIHTTRFGSQVHSNFPQCDFIRCRSWRAFGMSSENERVFLEKGETLREKTKGYKSANITLGHSQCWIWFTWHIKNAPPQKKEGGGEAGPKCSDAGRESHQKTYREMHFNNWAGEARQNLYYICFALIKCS